MDAIKDTTKNFAKGLLNPNNKLSLIPNWLSFSRVIGGFIIPIMAYTNAPLPMLFKVITFLALSDFLDGFTARIIAKEETKEGAMLDAVSDKIFSVLLIIGILPIMPIFAINGALEGKIALTNAKLLAQNGKPKSNLLGKVKIWPLSIALILAYLALAVQNLNISGITNETLIAASTALSIATMPIQIINIKQYSNDLKKHLEKRKNEVKSNEEETKEKQNTKTTVQEKTKIPKLKLKKENHQAIFYELEKKQVKEKQKILTKKPLDKH